MERIRQILKDKKANIEVVKVFGDWVVNADNDIVNINPQTAYCSLYSNRQNLLTQEEVIEHFRSKVWFDKEQEENLKNALRYVEAL